MKGFVVEGIRPAGIAKDIPPQGDGSARPEQIMDLFQRIDRVKPMEGRRSGDEIEGGRLEIRGLQRSRHDIKTRVVDRGARGLIRAGFPVRRRLGPSKEPSGTVLR